MKKVIKYCLKIIIIIALGGWILYVSGLIGLFESTIESDARKQQNIDDVWQSSKSISDSMGALLFYDAKTNDSIYSIYLNRKGFSYGYFFRSGGSRSDINEGVCEFYFDGYGAVLLSMNKPKINHIEIDNGQEVKSISVDSEIPFAVVLPENCGMVKIYDANNNIIPITSVIVND